MFRGDFSRFPSTKGSSPQAANPNQSERFLGWFMDPRLGQAPQVLLMGSQRRSAVAAMSAAQRAAIGAAMAQDTAEALGLLEGQEPRALGSVFF